MTRGNVARALRQVGKSAEQAILALESAIADDDTRVRREAASTLLYLQEGHPKSLAEFAAQLTDISPNVRCHAAIAVGNLGPLGLPAAPLIQASLRDDKDFNVKASALEALEKLGVAPHFCS